MRSDDEALGRFLADRFPRLRRCAFLMCGDWTVADEQARATLARLVADSHSGLADPDAYAWSDLMHAFQQRPGGGERAYPASADAGGEEPELVLVLGALHRLAPRCRAVLVMRHAEGFQVGEVADVLGLPEGRVAAYEAAGLRALHDMLGRGIPAEPGMAPPDTDEAAAAPASASATGAALGEAIDDIFRRAETVRRRRIRALLGAAAGAAAGLVAVGYALTALLLPGTSHPSAAAGPSTVTVDPVLAVLRPALRGSGLRVEAREPARGPGWRRYLVLTAAGRPRGLVEVAAYAAPPGLCFPARGGPGACALPERAGGAAYVRYAVDGDWRVNEVIARRPGDGRVIVVQAAGERGTGSAAGGRPALSTRMAARIATDARIAAGFGAAERCIGPDGGCPVLAVPLPVTPGGG
jgi:DNA-directed RNA polymerase specialized sigma24 family protein